MFLSIQKPCNNARQYQKLSLQSLKFLSPGQQPQGTLRMTVSAWEAWLDSCMSPEGRSLDVTDVGLGIVTSPVSVNRRACGSVCFHSVIPKHQENTKNCILQAFRHVSIRHSGKVGIRRKPRSWLGPGTVTNSGDTGELDGLCGRELKSYRDCTLKSKPLGFFLSTVKCSRKTCCFKHRFYVCVLRLLLK